MFRWLIITLLALSCQIQAGEHIFVSGGPALRTFERFKKNDHDKYWGNFIDSVVARQKQVRNSYSPDDIVTWLIFREGYVTRGQEEKTDYLPRIENAAKRINAKLIWFDTKQELIDYINKGQDRSIIKIERLEYFGHSNKRCFMFDYSNRLDGAGPDYGMLHLDDLKNLSPSSFDKDAHCQSWGCHSGEEYSGVWYKYVRVPMLGAIGKTDYSKGGVPILSRPENRWHQ